MYSSTITIGTATSTTCHVTKVIIIKVAATSIVPDITKVIVYGTSKSNVLKSDETCIIQKMKNIRHVIYICRKITKMLTLIFYPSHYPSNWSGIKEQHRRLEH